MKLTDTQLVLLSAASQREPKLSSADRQNANTALVPMVISTAYGLTQDPACATVAATTSTTVGVCWLGHRRGFGTLEKAWSVTLRSQRKSSPF